MSNNGFSSNGFSSPEDFQKKWDEKIRSQALPLTLPSGLKILAFRPSLEWTLRHFGRLPQTLAARVIGSEGTVPARTVEELVEFSNWTIELVSTIVIQPKIGRGPGMVDPGIISDEDLLYISRFAGGEVSADDPTGLDRFPGGPTSTATPDPGGDSLLDNTVSTS